MTKKYVDELSYATIGACIEVHRALGPGLLESVYHRCLMHELQLCGIAFQTELIVPVSYKGFELNAELRCDFVIEDTLVLEIKAVDTLLPIHEAKLLTYMNLLHLPKGLLINFTCTNIFKDGQKSRVNDLYRQLPDNY